MIERLVLIGLSGTGKSTISAELARKLGWNAFDTDQEIEARTGRTIPAIFREDGEGPFRAIEREVMLDALSSRQVVIATGGGAVINEEIWANETLTGPVTLKVWLDASPETLVTRLKAQAAKADPNAERPLLEGDALGRLRGMRETRAPFYSRANVSISVEDRASEVIADALTELIRLGCGEASHIEVHGKEADSKIQVGAGLLNQLPQVIAETWPKSRRVWIGIDQGVEPFLRDCINDLFAGDPREIRFITIPSGEDSKSVTGLSAIYDQVLGGGLDRGDVMVAVGGGVVGDLVGFAAASLLRGVGLVQVPTTLLSMVDSSVGGKTGINHPAGKNLIGAFYQPHRVLIDPELLASLPEREYISGWAEIVKHAVIQRSTPGGENGKLLDTLERNRAALLNREHPLLAWVVRQNVSLKAAVVTADEREAGIRAFLNFGHTIGHGIEAAGYTMLHGEAIAIGTVAALNLAVDLGRIDAAFRDRIADLLKSFGLPISSSVDAERVRELMQADKKKSGGKQVWILPNAGGRVEAVTDVPEEAIQRAITSVIS